MLEATVSDLPRVLGTTITTIAAVLHPLPVVGAPVAIVNAHPVDARLHLRMITTPETAMVDALLLEATMALLLDATMIPTMPAERLLLPLVAATRIHMFVVVIPTHVLAALPEAMGMVAATAATMIGDIRIRASSTP